MPRRRPDLDDEFMLRAAEHCEDDGRVTGYMILTFRDGRSFRYSNRACADDGFAIDMLLRLQETLEQNDAIGQCVGRA